MQSMVSRLGELGAALARFYRDGSRGDRARYVLAALFVASGLFHLGVQAARGGPWLGPVSWRKPATFGLAFGLTLATLNWVTTFVAASARRRARLLDAFAAASAVEVVVITTQAWRGVPSHFNFTSAGNAAFAVSAAGGGAVLVVTTLVFAVASARAQPALAPSLRLAVRVGFASFVAALASGALMIALGTRAARRDGALAAAYAVTAALKPAHAVTMHGILILPALAWLAAFTGWSEAGRVRAVGLAAAGYLALAAAVVAECLAGVDPLAPRAAPLASAVAGAGLLALVAAAVAVVAAAVTARPSPARR